MAKKETKIQPAEIADETQVGQTQEGATDVQEMTMEKFAGMADEQKVAYINNANNFIKSATQKSQEAAEIRKQNEQTRAEAKYYKAQAEQVQANLAKVYEQMSQIPQQQTASTPSQPPEYDPYNPDKWARDYQKYYEERLGANNSKYDELSKKFKELEDSTNVGIRTLRLEKYLEKAIPEIGKDVSIEEIQIWVAQHPDADLSNMETLNQAIRERQAIYDEKAQKLADEIIAKKKQAAEGAQDVEGSPFAGSVPDRKKFADMTPAEREAMVADSMDRNFRAIEGGG